MRIHLIKKQTIQGFADSHASGKSAFENWVTAIKYADWITSSDIQLTFGTADILGNGSNRVVFNIGGNNYRLIGQFILEPLRFTYLFVGLARMLSTMNFADMGNNLL